MMKSKRLLSKLAITASFLFASQIALAQINACPSIEDLKNFDGFIIEYPLNLDVNTQEPLSWLVAQSKNQEKKHIVQNLLISPVMPNQGEYPYDKAYQMLDSFVPLDNKLYCDKDSIICGCFYWNPNDGSYATFSSIQYKLKNPPSFASQMKMSAKLMSTVKGLKKIN